jgi:hypothetical protein
MLYVLMYIISGNVGVNLSAAAPNTLSSSKGPAGGRDAKDSAPNSPASTNPTLDARTKFGANLFLLSGIELAHVIMTLEQECPYALEHVKEEVQLEDDPNNNESKAVSPKLEINVDEISHAVFSELSAYVTDKVGTKGHSDVKMDDITASRPKKKQRK